MTAHLTPFQLRTELSLGELLDRRGVRPSGRKIEGQSAPYICIAVDSTTLWIYVDGASIIGPGVDHGGRDGDRVGHGAIPPQRRKLPASSGWAGTVEA